MRFCRDTPQSSGDCPDIISHLLQPDSYKSLSPHRLPIIRASMLYSLRHWQRYENAQEAEIKYQSFNQSLTPSIQSVNLSTILLSLFLFTSCPLRFFPCFQSFRTEIRVSMILGLRGMGLPSRCSWVVRCSELLCTVDL